MIINTKKIVNKIKEDHKLFFHDFELKNNRKVNMCIVRVGENKVSDSYVNIKTKYAEYVGIDLTIKSYNQDISQEYLISEMNNINTNYDGIIVQLPLTKNMDKNAILNNISLEKDIDLLNNRNQNSKESRNNKFTQPVVFAILQIIQNFSIDLNNKLKYKNILILGNGNLVGKPFSEELSRQNIEHKIVDKNTEETEVIQSIKEADFIVSGLGQANFLKPEMIKQGVVLVDSGTSEDGDTIYGDIDRSCAFVASLLSSTPRGVGPLTVCGLFENLKLTVESTKQS